MTVVWSPRAIRHLGELRAYIDMHNPAADRRLADTLLKAVAPLPSDSTTAQDLRILRPRKITIDDMRPDWGFSRVRLAGRSGDITTENNDEEEQLRLAATASLMEEAKKVAKAEGVAVNQLINVAVAEKVSALRPEEYFAERRRRSAPSTAGRLRIRR